MSSKKTWVVRAAALVSFGILFVGVLFVGVLLACVLISIAMIVPEGTPANQKLK